LYSRPKAGPLYNTFIAVKLGDFSAILCADYEMLHHPTFCLENYICGVEKHENVQLIKVWLREWFKITPKITLPFIRTLFCRALNEQISSMSLSAGSLNGLLYVSFDHNLVTVWCVQIVLHY